MLELVSIKGNSKQKRKQRENIRKRKKVVHTSEAKLVMENCNQKGDDDSCQQETEVVFPHQ